jgi:hypothetical protein
VWYVLIWYKLFKQHIEIFAIFIDNQMQRRRVSIYPVMSTPISKDVEQFVAQNALAESEVVETLTI